jgi:hypothetical protein
MGTDRDRGAGWAGFRASHHHLRSRAFPVPPVRSRASSCESSSPVSSKSKIRPFSAILSRWVVEEPDTAAQFLLDAFDRPERLSRIRALVVAVLEDQPPRGRAADVVNRLVDRLQGRLVVLPYHVSRHGILRVPRAASARRPCSGIGLGSSRLCVAAALLARLGCALEGDAVRRDEKADSGRGALASASGQSPLPVSGWGRPVLVRW